MGAYIDLYGDIEKLQLFQETSKSSEQQYLKAFQSLNSDKTELYDKGKGITALQEYRNLDPLEIKTYYRPTKGSIQFNCRHR